MSQLIAGQSTLVVNHSTGEAHLDTNGMQPIHNGDEFRVSTGSVRVHVAETNTALYTFQTTGEDIEAKEIQALRGFLKGLGPYLAEGAAQATEDIKLTSPSMAETLEPELSKIEDHLMTINEALFGEEGILNTQLQVFETLREMRRSLAGTLIKSAESLANELAMNLAGRFRQTQPVEDSCGHPLTRYFDLTALERIQEALVGLTASLMQVKTLRRENKVVFSEAGEKLLAEGRKALSDSEDLRASGLGVEALARRTLEARSVWCSEEFRVSTSKGVKLTINVSGAKEADLAPLADRPELKLQVTLVPDWLARPALGLAFLYSPDSTFPKFGTREVGEKFEIVQPDQQDSRFTYGLTLGLTWRGLDWREKNGAAIWIPELTVNPSSDVRAVGTGAAFSWWKILKVGVGYLWTKHKVLDGLSEGDLLESAEDLRVRDSYQDGKWYISISLIGWPPFLPE